jgi:hypothetical protein
MNSEGLPSPLKSVENFRFYSAFLSYAAEIAASRSLAWYVEVESLLGLAGSFAFFLFNRCVCSPSCPADNWLAGAAFNFYTSYVATGQSLGLHVYYMLSKSYQQTGTWPTRAPGIIHGIWPYPATLLPPPIPAHVHSLASRSLFQGLWSSNGLRLYTCVFYCIESLWCPPVLDKICSL